MRKTDPHSLNGQAFCESVSNDPTYFNGTNGNMGNKLTDHIGYTFVSF